MSGVFGYLLNRYGSFRFWEEILEQARNRPGRSKIDSRRAQTPATPGAFAVVHRQWRTGNRIELDMPMTMRLEPVDPQHPQTVASVFEPLVLFAITDDQRALTREQLLAAKRMGQRSWEIRTTTAPIKLLPFTDIGEEEYSTYLRVT
jgi:hypothetical protein